MIHPMTGESKKQQLVQRKKEHEVFSQQLISTKYQPIFDNNYLNLLP